jgi:uncharacterized membrane protein YdjX (TVP38/TMEM64 family)
MNKNYKRSLLLFLLLILILVFFTLDLGRFLTLEYLKNSKEYFNNFYSTNPSLVIFLFFITYIIITALSLPGAAIMTLAAGAVFGLLVGVLIVSFASSIGATLAAFFSRYLFRDSIEKKFKDKLKIINHGIETQGHFYLFTLRLIPLFPFFVINLVMGLTKMKLKTFYLVSQIGMLLGTIVYVNAGKELGKIDLISGILSPSLILSFVILGLFPIGIKKVISCFKDNYLNKNQQK